MAKKKSKAEKFFENKAAVAVTAVLILAVLFAAAFFITTAIVNRAGEDVPDEPSEPDTSYETPEVSEPDSKTETEAETTTEVPETTTKTPETTTAAPPVSTTAPSVPANGYYVKADIIEYPADTASWEMICLNRRRCVDSSVENTISLSYVAGSGELMDSRAAAAYEKMFDAAALDGIYLTPCSGYRSYSTQKRLFNEYVNDYLNEGYSYEQAEDLASRRRNPPGSSEHNIGICMDIICAASSANFENTRAYAWLTEHAADYGYILRYPADKSDITGVKFEPWHWRYVGVDNAKAIRESGLCLEEYLGLV